MTANLTKLEPAKFSLGKKITLWILAVSGVLTLIGTAVQLYFDYRVDVREIDKAFQIIESSQLNSLTNDVWVMDERDITVQLKEMLNLPNIAHVALQVDGLADRLLGRLPEPRLQVQRRFTLLYGDQAAGEGVKIGVLSVTATLAQIYQALWDKVAIILVTQAIKTFLIAFFIYFLVYALVTRHLKQVSNYVTGMQIDAPEAPLQLGRGSVFPWVGRRPDPHPDPYPGLQADRRADRRDELDVLVSAINGLRRDLRSSMSALGESEQRFRALTDLLPLSVFEADALGRLTYCNKKTLKLFGLSPADLLAGLTVADLLVDRSPRGGSRNVARALQQGRTRGKGMECLGQRKGGDLLPVLAYSSPILRAGSQIGLRGVVVDISQRKKVETQLRMAKDEAERANRVKSEFLASMSHELRTPLNAILGFSELLLLNSRAPLPPPQKDQVGSILSAGKHLLGLVNDILDLVMIESDQIALHFEHSSANDVVRNSLAFAGFLAEKRGIRIDDQFSDRGPVLLCTDQLRLRQVLVNLLTNAVKYNHDQGAVRLRGQETDDGFLRLSIIDSGIGIADEDQENIFQMFHRLNANSKVASEGMGIGLTVTKLLVERMSGRIGFESQKGVGSTFWFELPLASNKRIIFWDKKLSCGLDAMDRDHQVVIQLLNKMARRDLTEAAVNSISEQLLDRTLLHLRREEAVLELCGDPDFESHRREHQEHDRKVRELLATWRRESDWQARLAVHDDLRRWWLQHICVMDAEIARHAKGKGAEIRRVLEYLP